VASAASEPGERGERGAIVHHLDIPPAFSNTAALMAEPKTNELMEKIVSLCKRRGFIFQSSEIYGGINGFWDYGPLGAELKRNVKDLWWNTMTRLRDDVAGLEATIIMAPQIWKASGHVDTFADMMRECPLTKKRVRADQVDPQSGTAYFFKGAEPEDYIPKAMVADLEAAVQEHLGQLPAHLASDAQRLLSGTYDVAQRQSVASLAGVVAGLPAADPSVRGVRSIIADFLRPREQASSEAFGVIIDTGKHADYAIKIAREFYRLRGVVSPKPLLDRTEPVQDSTDFHPESRVLLGPARPFNLMFKTYVGPVADEDSVAYLRPETAQAIFAQFKNVLETSRQKVPFGIAQVGKAFRNEVTPRNFTFRSREFEQMELEYFIKPDEAVEAISGAVTTPGVGHPGEPQPSWGWQTWHKYWVEERIRFYESIGLPRATLEEYWQKPEELAHYAKATVDILFKFPFGTQELEGIAARSDFDLSQHQRFSGKSMGVFDDELRTAWSKLDDARKQVLWQRYHDARLSYLTKSGVPAEHAAKQAKEDADALAKGNYIPHVVEPSAGVDRLILALITNAYSEDQVPDDKGKLETRVVMRFHPRVAPIKVAVFPLLRNKPELVKKALEVRDLLRPRLTVFYDDAGAIGRRYRRQDEAGTPFGVTIDFDTLGEKGPELADTVTLRDRDTCKQERVKIGDLLGVLQARLR
jgi:glycyl-tRNA synthetase